MDDDNLKKSRISRTKSLLNSFKMTDSLFINGGNKKVVNLEVKGLRLIGKEQYKKQTSCQVCFVTFTKLTRQHHCRVCANAVCSSCSPSSINKQRVCDVCAFKYSHDQRQKAKKEVLGQLKYLAMYYVKSRNTVENEVKKTTEELRNGDDRYAIMQESERKQEQLNRKLEELKQKKQRIDIELIKSN